LENNSKDSSNQSKRIPGSFLLPDQPAHRPHFSLIVRFPVTIILVGLLFLAACSSGGLEPTIEPSPIATLPAPLLATVPPKATDPGPPTPAEYPPPAEYPSPADGDIGAPEPPGYPEPPPAEPTLDPYPGGFAVIQIAAGIQCEDPLFPNLDSATAALEQAGIMVQEAEEMQLMVCESCSCPTSTHYRVLIHPAELDAALALGWQRGN
jgi:hypothetical protein